MSWKVNLSSTITFLLVAPCFFFGITANEPPIAKSHNLPPFGIGDWVVTGNETLENRSLLLDGNLTIQSGGSLTISNATLTVYSEYSEEHEIEVLAGGTLKVINGSMVNSLGEWNTFGFWVRKDANIIFEDSIFITCGVRWFGSAPIQGGIVIYSDKTTIKNCIFTSAFIALTIFASAKLYDCNFTNNYIGLAKLTVPGVPVSFQNCTFSENGYGFVGDADFDDCLFNDNAGGIFGGGTIRNCLFVNNFGIGGIYTGNLTGLYAANAYVTDCEFLNNHIGIACPPPGLYDDLSEVYLTNSNFSNNMHGTYTPVNKWTINRSCRIKNDTVAVGGNVTVEADGNLLLNRSVLEIDNSNYIKNGIEVKSQGRIALEASSAILAYNASFPYSFRCRPGSSFSMNGSLLRDCGWDIGSPNSSGPLMETSNVWINSSTIDFSPAAMVFNGSKGAIVERSYLRGFARGLVLNSSSVFFRNSTLVVVDGNSATLDRGSLLDSMNSVINRKKLDFRDAASRANFSWLADVRAVWADGRPVEGANLTIQDVSNAIVNRTTAGEDGYFRRVTLMEASLARDASLNITPHLFNCTKSGIWNRTAVTINSSREITLMLADDQHPIVNITYPSDGIAFNTGAIIVNGTARDNICLDRIEVVLDGHSRRTVFLSNDTEAEETDWNASFELDDGYHSFEAVATDLSGNSASAFITIRVDTLSPRIRIASPQEGQLVNTSLITMSGFMEPGARVFICGSEAKTDRDKFSGSITLFEGPNFITAIAADAAGNTNSSSVTVRLDSVPPMLDVQSPVDGLQTRSPTIEVSGSIEPGSEVFVNGRQVAPGNETGAFHTTISLTKGLTTVTVDAVDKAGNHNVTARKVVLDTTPPFLRVSSPAEGRITNRSSISITGEAEAGSYLTVAGNSQQLQGTAPARANFSAQVSLNEGLNTLLVTALDMAGNTNKSVIHVTLDTIAPTLSVESPLNGSSTANSTVLVEGFTEPGARLTVNGQQVLVGYTGSFSVEVRLSTGNNSITVLTQDLAGNPNEVRVGVQRVPARVKSPNATGGGPDWLFTGFLTLAAVVAASEFYIFSRHIRGLRIRVEGGG